MYALRSFPLSFALLFLLQTAAYSGPASLLALSKADHTLAIVDPSGYQVLAKLPVGNDPHEVIASADGTTAYVSNYGGGAFNTLAVLDLTNHRALPSIDLGALRGPHGLFFAGGKLWFTAEGAKAVARYDPATKAIDWICGTGQNRTHMLFVMSDLSRIITTNIASATVSFLEKMPPRPAGRPGPPPMPNGDWNETVVAVGQGDEGFDVSPDGKEIWVANARDGSISVLSNGDKRVVDTVAAGTTSANRLKFTPDGKLVFVSSLNQPDATVIDAATHKVVKRLPIGRGAAGIQMEPNGKRVFIACTPDNYVAVIDLATLAVDHHLDVGGNPDGLAWAVTQ